MNGGKGSGERDDVCRERGGGEYNVFGCGLLGNDSISVLEVFATHVYTETLGLDRVSDQ